MNDNMINPIEYDLYNKITDDIAYIGDNAVVRFVVGLSRKNKQGEQSSYHREYEYGPAYNRRYSIKRSFDFYAVIENVKIPDGFNMRDSVRIYMGDLYFIQTTLDQVSQWLLQDDYFINDRGALILHNAPSPITVQTGYRKRLTFELAVVVNRYNEQTPGIRMTINTHNNVSVMDYFEFMGMYMFFKNADFYAWAQNMINYIQRPQLGTNLSLLPASSNPYDERKTVEQDVSAPAGRQIPAKKKVMSFFDRVDNEMR